MNIIATIFMCLFIFTSCGGDDAAPSNDPITLEVNVEESKDNEQEKTEESQEKIKALMESDSEELLYYIFTSDNFQIFRSPDQFEKIDIETFLTIEENRELNLVSSNHSVFTRLDNIYLNYNTNLLYDLVEEEIFDIQISHSSEQKALLGSYYFDFNFAIPSFIRNGGEYKSLFDYGQLAEFNNTEISNPTKLTENYEMIKNANNSNFANDFEEITSKDSEVALTLFRSGDVKYLVIEILSNDKTSRSFIVHKYTERYKVNHNLRKNIRDEIDFSALDNVRLNADASFQIITKDIELDALAIYANEPLATTSHLIRPVDIECIRDHCTHTFKLDGMLVTGEYTISSFLRITKGTLRDQLFGSYSQYIKNDLFKQSGIEIPVFDIINSEQNDKTAPTLKNAIFDSSSNIIYLTFPEGEVDELADIEFVRRCSGDPLDDMDYDLSPEIISKSSTSISYRLTFDSCPNGSFISGILFKDIFHNYSNYWEQLSEKNYHYNNGLDSGILIITY
ncbi:hypothetical protein OAB57_00505 [Bacteriovoracaceae bacterium]|nr:hypothetical protein [Bacteriovoracaceae bacterium]